MLVSRVREYREKSPQEVNKMLDEIEECGKACLSIFDKCSLNKISSQQMYNELAVS